MLLVIDSITLLLMEENLKKRKKKVVRPLEKGLLNQLESLRLNSALFVPSLIEFGPIV